MNEWIDGLIDELIDEQKERSGCRQHWDTEVLMNGSLVSAGDQNSFNCRILSQQIDLMGASQLSLTHTHTHTHTVQVMTLSLFMV